MLRKSWIFAAVLACAAGPVTAQVARRISSEARLATIAGRWAAPETLPDVLQRELEQTFAGLEGKHLDVALPHWREFLWRRELLETGFDPNVYLDYLLNRLAAVRDKKVDEAKRRLRFYDMQENAVFEHLSLVDKQLSAYAGADNPKVPLREPELAEYSYGAEPVTLAPSKNAGVDDLTKSLQHWKERSPEISAARLKAREDFVHAVQANAELGEELQALDVKLRAEIKEFVSRPETRELAVVPETR